MFASLVSVAARAADVGVLVVGDNAQYIDAARAAHKALDADAELAVISAEAPLPEAWRQRPPKVIIAVGARAVRLALAGTDGPVVAAMVLQESPELANRRVRAVPVAAPTDKQLSLLKRLAPKARRVGMVVDPSHAAAAVEEARAAAARNGQTLIVKEVNASGEVPAALASVRKDADAIVLLADTTVVRRETLDALVHASQAGELPVIGYSAAVIQAGLFAGFAVDPDENGRVAAAIARALASGAEPAALRPAGRLHVNLKVARALGLTVPSELLAPPTVVFDPR